MGVLRDLVFLRRDHLLEETSEILVSIFASLGLVLDDLDLLVLLLVLHVVLLDALIS